MSDLITILAIETSCDETAAAVLRGGFDSEEPAFEVLSSVVRSQIEIHATSGGVIPEVAARAHSENILPVVTKALGDANISLDDVDYFAVTSGPGLIVSLIVGTEFTKALAYATGKPLIPTNHMAGHMYSGISNFSPFAEATEDKKQFLISNETGVANSEKTTQFPVLSMIVSGGHTMLVVMKDYFDYQVIGSTVDDAAGEAYDKVAKLLGLPYPGGPAISRLAAGYQNQESRIKNQELIAFPRPMIYQENYDFSFSGLKTAVRNYIKDLLHNQDLKTTEMAALLSDEQKGLIAASFEEAVCDVLVTKAMKACAEYGCKTISLSGGVAADKKLRAWLTEATAKRGIRFVVPDMRLCTDNAEMIAIAAYMKIRGGYVPEDAMMVEADPNWEI